MFVKQMSQFSRFISDTLYLTFFFFFFNFSINQTLALSCMRCTLAFPMHACMHELGNLTRKNLVPPIGAEYGDPDKV